jgi:lipoate-protein ligase A
VPLPENFRIRLYDSPLPNGIAMETKWMEEAAEQLEAKAHFWQAPTGWVVPRNYATQVRQGPEPLRNVQVRASGGGLVPQGPGIWNVSLVWPVREAGQLDTCEIYRFLCARLANALRELGIFAEPGSVNGSFCDGRFNLAVGGRKLVGMAQAWKRIQQQQIVLAHAVVLVDVDPVQLTTAANAFEASIGSGVRYDANALTCIANETCFAGAIEVQAISAMASQFSKQMEVSYGFT